MCLCACVHACVRVRALVCGDMAAQCRQGCCDGWGAGQSLIRRAPLSRRQECPAGKVTSVPGAKTADDCVACPKGTFAEAGSSACTDCPAGTYRDTKGGEQESDCDACEAGKFSDIKRAVAESTCLECLAGTFAAAGDTVCTLCDAGKFSEVVGVDADDADDCQGCSAGTYAHEGSSSCTECVAGTVSGDEAGDCEACEEGTYQSAAGASVCIECGDHTISGEGSNHKTKCKCVAGKHGAFADADAEQLTCTVSEPYQRPCARHCPGDALRGTSSLTVFVVRIARRARAAARLGLCASRTARCAVLASFQMLTVPQRALTANPGSSNTRRDRPSASAAEAAQLLQRNVVTEAAKLMPRLRFVVAEAATLMPRLRFVMLPLP